MKRYVTFALVSALATTMFATAPARAQGLPDVQDAIVEGSQVDAAIATGTREGIARVDDTEIDGEAGIYVLRKNDIFYVGGVTGLSYSENPSRTSDDLGDSFAAEFAAVAGVQTRIDQKYDLGASVTVSGIEYFEDFAPSSRNTIGTVTIGTPLSNTPLYVSASAFGGYNFDNDFENGTGFYGGSASLSAAFLLGPRTILNPGVGFTRQWSGIDENDSTSLGASASITHQLDPRASLRAEVGVRKTWYDNFYEDVTFVERRDTQYSGAVSASYRLDRTYVLNATVGYEKRDSTLFLSEYESFEAGLQLSIRASF